MNQPIIRLFGLVVVMFALLVGFTSRWTIFEATSLRSNPLNARALLQQQPVGKNDKRLRAFLTKPRKGGIDLGPRSDFRHAEGDAGLAGRGF